MTTRIARLGSFAGLVLMAAAVPNFTLPAFAQSSAVLNRGDAVVTGFSGTRAADPAPEGDPLDEVFIDLDGASMQILPLQSNAPPAGQLLQSSPLLQIKARDVGQVFAVGLDDGLKPQRTGVTPNIYLGATSAFGLHIVIPDSDGDGRPERIKKGHPNAVWMAGQFGANGGPGTIWKVDGTSGAVSPFATLPGNAGPGVGDIVYDTSSLHFYASDLDTGLIHRIDSAGNLIDTFDHGVKAREQAGLEPVADDGATLDITSEAFDALDPATWRMTQSERRVWGLGLNGGRLYYAIANGPEVWSVSIKLDGSFGDDARREFEVSGTPANNAISDIAFDGQGMMYLAQRGAARAGYDYANFTEAKTSVVFRYKREIPDDTATPGIWVPVPDEFAIGLPPDHRNTAGGLALGYGYGDDGRMRTGMCGAFVWSTGDNLRGDSDSGPANVHGLQGVDRMLVRPDNEPPAKSFFLDYDGRFDDPAKSGQVGDVEIWQPCDQASYGLGPYAPMPYLPPNYIPPSYYPPGYVPPVGLPPVGWPPVGWPWDFNLHLDKEAVPVACVPGGLGFLCTYTVRVTNTGPDPYIGPVTVHDHLPAAPAGAIMTFDNQPPWTCVSFSPTEHDCTHDPAVLWPGSSIDLKVTVDTPAPAPVCSLDNFAQLKWSWGFTDNNPGDDFDMATAGIPAAHCPPVAGAKSNLQLTKFTWQPICKDLLGHFACNYLVYVKNVGPAAYNGTIKIDEQIPAGTTATFAGGWTCSAVAPYSCEIGPLVLAKNQGRLLGVTVNVPKNIAGDLGCKAINKAEIVEAAGGTDQNTDPTDDAAQAQTTIPGTLQQCPGLKLGNLRILKTDVTGGKCPVVGANWECKFNVKVSNFGKTYANELVIRDLIPVPAPAGVTATFQPPATWNCGATGFPQEYFCKTANPGLTWGESLDIGVTVKTPVSKNVKQCWVRNTAVIIKAPAGSAQNTFGGDDVSSAIAHFQGVFANEGNAAVGICLSPMVGKPDKPITTPEKQDTNLSITKTAGASTKTAGGQNTPFVITVTNTGPGVYFGPIVVRETLPGEPSNASWSAPWTCEGQTMAGQPNDALCSHPPVELKPGESVTLNLEVEMPNSFVAPSGSNVTCGYTNKVAIEEAAGATPQNTNAGDDTASAQVKFAPFEKHGRTFCGIDDLTTPPPVSCPQGWSTTPIAGKCCPPRSRWNGKRCERGTPETCKQKSCDRGERWDSDSCSCVNRQCPAGTVGDYPNCKPEDCPPGFIGTPPNCTRRIVDPPQQCLPKSCDRNERWDSGSCSCIDMRCPPGTVGAYPNCKPKECPSGFVGTPPNCRPVLPPACKPKACGRHATWDSGSCSCVAKDCPAGMVGRYPNCRKPPEPCKPGFTGTPPNCKRIIVDPPPPRKCPDGMTGKPPHCKRVPPAKCPDGFKGKPPHCKRIVVDPPPRRCPLGMVGKPPHCRKLPQRCPPGFKGFVPHCKPIHVPQRIKPQRFMGMPQRHGPPRMGPARMNFPRLGPGIRR